MGAQAVLVAAVVLLAQAVRMQAGAILKWEGVRRPEGALRRAAAPRPAVLAPVPRRDVVAPKIRGVTSSRLAQAEQHQQAFCCRRLRPALPGVDERNVEPLARGGPGASPMKIQTRPCLVATALAIACSSEPVESLPASCTARDQNAYVYQILRHYYLWADQLPSVSPSEFGSPEELVAELIDGELDPWTQFARVPQEPQAGFGYRLQKWGDELWVVWSHPASDAHAAGLRRGAQVLAIGGVPAGTLDPSVSIGDLGESVEHTFIDGVGDAHTITLARNFPFEITVGDANSTVVDDLVVGYLLLFNLGISGATELPDAIARFASAGVKHLIVDARYSGGGRVEIAQLLGSLLAGRVARGKPLMIQRYNGMHPELDRSLNVFE